MKGITLFVISSLVAVVQGFGGTKTTHEPQAETTTSIKKPWHTAFYPNATGDGLTFETFRSLPVSLRPGQVANNIKPAQWIKGPKAIRYVTTQIVDAGGNPVDEKDLYVHHWFFMTGEENMTTFRQSRPGPFNMGLCGAMLPGYGTGAELNGQVLTFPSPLAMVTTGDEHWGLNLHFIRTEGVPTAKVQDCIECRCPDSTPEKPHGSHFCPSCQDNAQCWGMENETSMETKDYFLEYTIGYTDVDEEIVPVSVLSLDAAHADSEGTCMVEYDLKFPEGEAITNTSTTVIPQDFNITLVASHLHVGGVQFNVEHWRDGKMIGMICETTAVYNEEDGHLIKMPFCLYDYGNAYAVKAGDELKLVSTYDTRKLIDAPYGYHMGVMSLVWIFGQAADQQALIASLASELSSLETVSTENWSPLDGVIFTPQDYDAENNQLVMTLTCADPTKWCGAGFNSKEQMADANVYTYSLDETSGEMALQARKLGQYNPGELLNANLEVMDLVTGDDNSVSVTFAVDASNLDEGSCSLAAIGSSPTFGYHISRNIYCP